MMSNVAIANSKLQISLLNIPDAMFLNGTCSFGGGGMGKANPVSDNELEPNTCAIGAARKKSTILHLHMCTVYRR